MKYLIDGHNLIAQLPDISLADPYDEARLIQLLARWRWRHNNPSVTVVFDPGDVAVYGRRRSKRSGITVRYAPHHSDADAVLMGLIERARRPAQLAVVSSDQEIQSVARRVGAQAISAEEFAVELTAPPEPQEKLPGDEPLPPEEVQKWLEIFQGRDGQPQ